MAPEGNDTLPALTVNPFDAVRVEDTVNVPVTVLVPVMAAPPADTVSAPDCVIVPVMERLPPHEAPLDHVTVWSLLNVAS